MTRTQQVLDLRLLLPCLTAWAVGAWALSWPGTLRAKGAAAAVVLLTCLVVAGVRYRGRHARPSWRRDGPGVLALTLAAMTLVLGSSAGHEWRRQLGPVHELAERGAMVRAEGVVLTEPRVRAGRPTGDDGGDAPARVLLRVRLESVTSRGVRTQVHAPVFIRGDAPWAEVGWHDRIELTGKLSPADPADPEVAELSPRGPPVPVGERSSVRAAAEHLRGGMREAVDPLPTDARALLPALVIGDTSMTPQELTDDMLVTGMSHLSAVSGTIVQQGWWRLVPLDERAARSWGMVVDHEANRRILMAAARRDGGDARVDGLAEPVRRLSGLLEPGEPPAQLVGARLQLLAGGAVHASALVEGAGDELELISGDPPQRGRA